MKKWFVVAALMLIILVAALGNLTTAAPAGIVYREGTHFYLDGKPYYFAGCNSYDLFTYGDGSNDSTPDYIENYFMNKNGIDTIMGQMADDGVTVVRTWGFSHEKWHGFEPEEGVYNEAQFMLFDYIMESARKHGIKIIITLENYWEAYGGIDKRLAWEGLPGSSHANRAQFFTNKGCQEQYRNYVKHFVSRVNHYTNVAYKDDPTLFAWELMNEPRYQDAGENATGKTLRAWVDEMGAYIKSLDPNHMVGVGIEGHESKYGFGGDEGNPFVYLQQSQFVDFCTAHPYPDETWANLSVAQTRKLVEAWIKDAHEVVGKPFILEEWNVHSNKDSYWPAILDEIDHHDAAGSLYWNYNDYRTSNFDMLKGDAILGTIFKPHAAKMAAKCGTVVSPTPGRTAEATPTPSKTPVFTSTPSKTPIITPTPSKTPVITPTPNPTTSQGYAVKYVVNDWGGGAAVNFTIKNTGTATVNGWQIFWTFPGDQKITNLWNGSYTQKDSKVTVDNLPYNGIIAPGGAVNFGFSLVYSGTNSFPGKFTVNGVNCIPEN